MHYENTCTGIFLKRPNRFIAEVEIDGKVEICHVKNTGRCKEILIEGVEVVLQQFPKESGRKTLFDLIAVYKNGNLINIDSQAPNKAFGEAISKLGILGESPYVRAETVHEDSRFDFYAENGNRKAFLEVKGVTLENNGVAMFPDAPTERGLKHIRGLIRCVEEGYEAYAVLIIQMKGIHLFKPNYETDPAFSEALLEASKAGVHVIAYDCIVTPDSMVVDLPVDVVVDNTFL